MAVLELAFASGEDSLSVRRFAVQETISRPFEVSLIALSDKHDIDLETLVGKPASFQIRSGVGLVPDRLWTGVVSYMELLHPEVDRARAEGRSTYALRLVPELWLLGQRRQHRIFQHLTLVAIVDKVLSEWGITPNKKIADEGPKHEFVVQYGETDLAFVSRLCEWAGVSYFFTFDEDKKSELMLSDAPQGADPRPGPPLSFVDSAPRDLGREYVTDVRITHAVRPGRTTLRDHDFRRKPDYALVAEAPPAQSPEDFYEQYHYVPGGFLVETSGGGDTPVADSLSVARHDDKEGKARAERALLGARQGRERVRYRTSTVDLAPGKVFAIWGHGHPSLAPNHTLLVTDCTLEGTAVGEWTLTGEAVFTNRPFRPELRTDKPRVRGVQSAVVVGPKSAEGSTGDIYTDEFGRVRVQFHWDRDGKYDEHSSCWLRVNERWAGAGFGTVHLPRVGQEVLVGFLEGDPDQPVVVGRVYNGVDSQVPYKLPVGDTRSTWKSKSTPNSTGFNEIMLDDLKGSELIYTQAQRDLQKLVKQSETERTGKNLTSVVGGNRSEVVGKLDATFVGGQYRLQMIAPPSDKDLAILGQGQPTLSVKPTLLDMVDKRIVFTTGKATLAFDGDHIALEAAGDISIKAKGGDVIIEGSHTYVNTKPPPAAPVPAAVEPPKPLGYKAESPAKPALLAAQPKAAGVAREATDAPLPKPPPAEPPANPEVVCGYVSAIVKCQHEGRMPNAKGVLEVVPADGDGDKITLTGKFKGGCGKHPEWTHSGPFGTTTEQKAATSFRARPWFVGDPAATLVLRWLAKVAPKSYSAYARACDGSSVAYQIKAYPKDKISIKWEAKEFEVAKKVLEALNHILKGFFPKAEVKGLVGAVSVEAAWAEHSDWRAFYKFGASIGFDPLFELSVRLPFGPTAAIPQWVKQWVGDVTFFVDFFGGVKVGANFGRETPDMKVKVTGSAEGQVGGRLGGMIKAGRICEVEIYGETAIKGTATAKYEEDKGPFVEFGATWTGLTGNFKLKFWSGKLEKQYSMQLIDERPIGDKREWLLVKKTA
ncbi:MAG: type VI secretion system tip protein VgrG [Polyangiaceae bacterium]|nr:type VI secretion system tip protein VgrG [Polyangiaceae bacterium]